MPDRNIGAGETLRSLQWVKLHENWNEGIKQILSVIQPNSARVHELIQALEDKSARVRIKVADDLGLLGGLADVAIPALTRALDDENETVCAAAAAALGEIGKASESVIARLIANIRRKNSHYANQHAIRALTKLGSPGIVALIQVVKDAYDAYYDRDVINALPGLGKPTVVALLEMLASTSIKDLIVYHILSQIRNPNAISELAEALHHEKIWVRIAAARALAGMKEHYLGEGETTNSIFLEVLSVLIEGVRSSDHRVCHLAISTLGEIGKQASMSVPILIEAMNDLELRCEVVKALGRIGSGNQVAVAALVKALKDLDADVRKHATIALDNIGEPIDIIVPALIEALEDPNADIRKYTVVALRKIGYNHTKRGARVKSLENQAQLAKSPLLPMVVPDIGEPIDIIVPALVKALEDPDAGVRKHAVVALGNIGEPIDTIVPVLVKALEDPGISVRDNAVIALGKAGRPGSEAVVALVEALRWPHNRSMRIYATEALGKIGDPACIPALMEAQNDQFEVIRVAATSALKQFGIPVARPSREIISSPSDFTNSNIYRILVEEGAHPGQAHEMQKDSISIGRSRESDIFLEDLAVNRLHAKIRQEDGIWVIEDADSTNGTRVNGQLLTKHQMYPLQEGDRIQVGQTVLIFSRKAIM